jgi:hypothetical protein
MAAQGSGINTVFILGAGASADSGTPVMSTFLDVAEALYRTNQVGDAAEDFRAIIDARSKLQMASSKSSLNILNIEDVFAAFEMGNTVEALPGYTPEQIAALLRSERRVISKTLGLTQRFRQNGSGNFSPPDPYGRFAQLVKALRQDANPPHNIAVITFNYDIGCDFAIATGGVAYSYFLGDFESSSGVVPLLKLHGSLNWGRASDDSIIPCRMEDFFSNGYTLEHRPGKDYWILDFGSRLEACPYLRGKNAPEPFIVPPTWDKTQYHKQIGRVWRKAAEVLRGADNIFISGYSLPPSDSFFRYLYAIGTVSEVVLRRFWVFDKASKEDGVDSNFRSLIGQAALGRYKYHQVSFDESISLVGRELGLSKAIW